MQITSPCVVSLTWRLQDTQGQLIDELTEPVEPLERSTESGVDVWSEDPDMRRRDS